MAPIIRTLASLRPNPKNPRTITAAKRKQLAAALDKFGDLGGIVFNARSGQLVGGHQRVSAFNAQTPVVITKAYDAPTRTGTVAEGYVVLSGERFSFREVQWDDATEKAANLAANKGAGEFDLSSVSSWLVDLDSEGFDLDLTMFDDDERAGLCKNEDKQGMKSDGSVDHESPDLPVSPRSKFGDRYILGRHTLICGDSSDDVLVSSLVENNFVQMVYSDPPYGMNLGQCNHFGLGKKRIYSRVIGDDAPYSPAFLLEKFGDVSEIFLWGADYYRKELPDGGSWVVWDKKSDDTGKVIEGYEGSQFELCWSKTKHSRKICRIIWQGFVGLHADGGKRHHPTQKPVQLAEWFFSLWGKPKDVVVDLYGGSGSTLLACERADRTCLMMEIDPGYCDVIVQRWEAMTGQKAQLVGNRTAKDALHA